MSILKKHQFHLSRLFRFILSVGVLCWVPVSAEAAGVSGSVRAGNALYDAGKYEDAAEKYNEALKKNSESDIINFNTGAALYQSGDVETAQTHFQKALLSSDDQLRQQAYYNLGNTFYRQAERIGPEHPQEAVPLLERSVDHYEQALALSPEDEDAQYNYEFVKQVLEKVKEQVEQQKQQCDRPDKDQNQNEQNKDQQQKKSGQDDQEDDRSGRQEEDQQQSDQQGEDQQQREQQGEDQQQQEDQSGQADKDAQDSRPSAGERQESSSGAGQQDEDLTRRDARRRLMEYQRNDEPQGLLNLRGTIDQRPVEKDW